MIKLAKIISEIKNLGGKVTPKMIYDLTKEITDLHWLQGKGIVRKMNDVIESYTKKHGWNLNTPNVNIEKLPYDDLKELYNILLKLKSGNLDEDGEYSVQGGLAFNVDDDESYLYDDPGDIFAENLDEYYIDDLGGEEIYGS